MLPDNPTAKFAIFVIFSIVSLLLGLAVRKKGLLAEDRSRDIHLHTILWTWSPAFFFALWNLPVAWSNVWLVVFQIVLVAGVGLSSIPLAKMVCQNRKQVGVFASACAISNIGITLGAFLCYSLIEASPDEDPIAYALAYTAVMQVVGIPVTFNICRHFGEADRGTPLWRMIIANFLDIRSTPLYFALAGWAMSLVLPRPAIVKQVGIMDVLFLAGCFGTYVGIGMRLHVSHAFHYVKQHVALAGVRFLLVPAIIAGLIYLVRFGPEPLQLTPKAAEVLLLLSFMPTAVMSVMLANLFHLDARFATLAWIWNTALFLVIVLPVLLLFPELWRLG